MNMIFTVKQRTNIKTENNIKINQNLPKSSLVQRSVFPLGMTNIIKYTGVSVKCTSCGEK